MRLRTIRVINETKGWTTVSASLARQGDTTTSMTVGLINRVIQAGNRDVKWDGNLVIADELIALSVEFLNADLGDTLVATVGFESE